MGVKGGTRGSATRGRRAPPVAMLPHDQLLFANLLSSCRASVVPLLSSCDITFLFSHMNFLHSKAYRLAYCSRSLYVFHERVCQAVAFVHVGFVAFGITYLYHYAANTCGKVIAVMSVADETCNIYSTFLLRQTALRFLPWAPPSASEVCWLAG